MASRYVAGNGGYTGCQLPSLEEAEWQLQEAGEAAQAQKVDVTQAKKLEVTQAEKLEDGFQCASVSQGGMARTISQL